MASPIGRPGPKKGPAKTSMGGSRQNPGNLGRRTDVKQGASMNRDVTTAFRRRGINPGPGGHQRPAS